MKNLTFQELIHKADQFLANPNMEDYQPLIDVFESKLQEENQTVYEVHENFKKSKLYLIKND